LVASSVVAYGGARLFQMGPGAIWVRTDWLQARLCYSWWAEGLLRVALLAVPVLQREHGSFTSLLGLS
jgi:hypothetical protein